MGNRVSRNTFDPRLATRSAIYRFTPEIRAITTISVETERIIPSSIKKERILCARSVSSATLTGSRSNTRRFIRSHPSVYSTINEETRFRLDSSSPALPRSRGRATRFPARSRESFFCEAKGGSSRLCLQLPLRSSTKSVLSPTKICRLLNHLGCVVGYRTKWLAVHKRGAGKLRRQRPDGHLDV